MLDLGDSYISCLICLLVAVILGAIIGIERAGTNHDAGLRTHALVCLGAAAVMVLSRQIMIRYGASATDMTRMGAQVISGIGFLGVGSIIVDGNKIRGLTTAAGLWATACVGLVVGSGYIELSVTIVALMMIVMMVLRPLAVKIKYKNKELLMDVALTDENCISGLISALSEIGVTVESINTPGSLNDEANDYLVSLKVYIGQAIDSNTILAKLVKQPGVKHVSIKSVPK